MIAHHYARALEYARDSGGPTEELERRTRLALRHAAERATALNSMTAALNHYDAAIALWPQEDPEWPALIVAAADLTLSGAGDELIGPLRVARDRLLDAGDVELAAKAEMLAGFRFWNQARTDEAADAFGRSRRLIEDAPPTPGVAHVMSRIAVNAMLRGSSDETHRPVRARARDHRRHRTRRPAQPRPEHPRRGPRRPGRHGRPRRPRGEHRDRGAAECRRPDDPRLQELRQRAGDARRDRGGGGASRGAGSRCRAGSAPTTRSPGSTPSSGSHAYLTGDWDAAEAALRPAGRVGGRGRPALHRGGRPQLPVAAAQRPRRLAGARADIAGALAFARRSGDPQMLYPTLADAALVAATGGGEGAAGEVAALMDEIARSRRPGAVMRFGDWAVAAAAAAILTDQPERFPGPAPDDASHWTTAAQAIAAGPVRGRGHRPRRDRRPDGRGARAPAGRTRADRRRPPERR